MILTIDTNEWITPMAYAKKKGVSKQVVNGWISRMKLRALKVPQLNLTLVHAEGYRTRYYNSSPKARKKLREETAKAEEKLKQLPPGKRAARVLKEMTWSRERDAWEQAGINLGVYSPLQGIEPEWKWEDPDDPGWH